MSNFQNNLSQRLTSQGLEIQMTKCQKFWILDFELDLSLEIWILDFI